MSVKVSAPQRGTDNLSTIQSGFRARSASVLLDPSTDAASASDREEDQPEVWEDHLRSGLADVQEDVTVESEASEGLYEQEIYESDLEEAIQGPKCVVKDWSELRKQIKTYLAKHSKSLPLTN